MEMRLRPRLNLAEVIDGLRWALEQHKHFHRCGFTVARVIRLQGAGWLDSPEINADFHARVSEAARVCAKAIDESASISSQAGSPVGHADGPGGAEHERALRRQ